MVTWELITDYNSIAQVATLSTSDGNTTSLTLNSTLKRGRVDAVKILSAGSGIIQVQEYDF